MAMAMEGDFPRALQALAGDRFRRRTLAIAALLLGLWGAWFSLSRVTIYAVSERARLEIERDTSPIDARAGGRVVASHIELGRVTHEPHAARVHDHVAEVDVRKVVRDLATDLQEQSARRLQDVRLVDEVKPAPWPRVGDLEGPADDPFTARARDDSPTLGDVLLAIEPRLEPRVEPLRVLPHDDQIDILERGIYAREVLRGPDVRKEIELCSKGHVDASVPLADRCGEGSLETDLALTNGRECLVRQWRAVTFRAGEPCLPLFPLDPRTGGFDRANGCGHDFGPDPVATNQGHLLHLVSSNRLPGARIHFGSSRSLIARIAPTIHSG